jgi:hypothetical protein
VHILHYFLQFWLCTGYFWEDFTETQKHLAKFIILTESENLKTMFDPSRMEAEFVFIDGFQLFAKSSKKRGVFYYLNFYFNQIGPKIKKWEQKIKNRIILNNTINLNLRNQRSFALLVLLILPVCFCPN